MKISLKLYTVLKDYLPANMDRDTLELPAEAKVADVITLLNIPQDLPKIILINGIQKSPEAALREGDELNIFPPISGG